MKLKDMTVPVAAALVLGAAVWLSYSCRGGRGLFERLFGGGPVIARTETVVEEIHRIAELTTAVHYEEIVMKDRRYSRGSEPSIKSLLGLEQNDKSSIVVIVRGRVRAGIDLRDIKVDDVRLTGDTLVVNVPHAKIHDVIVNPSDVEIFFREGDWSIRETDNIITAAKSRIRHNAEAEGILSRAEETAADRIATLLEPLGFGKVIVNTVDTGKEIRPEPVDYSSGRSLEIAKPR